MTSNSTSDDMAHAQWVSEIYSVYWQTIVCVIGFCLNVTNVVVFSKRQFVGSSIYILMTALSVADSLTLLLRSPTGLIGCFSQPWCKDLSARIYLYVYSTYVEVPITNMTENMSVWITMMLAVERYVAMRHYTLSKTYLTPRNTRILLIVIVSISVLFNMPFFFLFNMKIELRPNSTKKVYDLFTNKTAFATSFHYTIYSWIRLALVQGIPLIFLCLFNCLLFNLIYKHNKKFRPSPAAKTTVTIKIETNEEDPTENNNNNNCNEIEEQRIPLNKLTIPSDASPAVSPKRARSPSAPNTSNITAANNRQRAQVKLTTLLVAIVCLFLAGQIPQAIAYQSIYKTLFSCENLNACPDFVIYRTVTVNLGLIAYSCNFFLYLFLNTLYREALLVCLCPSRTKVLEQKDGKSIAPIENNNINKTNTNGVDTIKPVQP